MRDNPEFSIIMPTYNRAFCICSAIRSVLNQTYQNFELIIINDGSNDNTESLVKEKYEKEIANGKIKYFNFGQHVGVSKARNKGLELSKNPWIGYADTDNEMVKDYIEAFSNLIKSTDAYTYYGHIKHNISGKEVGKKFNWNKLYVKNFIDMGAFVHARKVYEELGGFNEEMTRIVDWDLVITYTRKYVPIYMPKIVVKYNDSNEHKRISNTEDAKINAEIMRKKHGIKVIKLSQDVSSKLKNVFCLK